MATFGAATIASPMAPRNRGRKFDCGKFGKMTAQEIARLTGMSREGVWQRVKAGIHGAELCAPKHDGLRKTKTRCSRPTIMVAMKLLRAFPANPPSVAQIKKIHPMTDRNAMRWRQALVDTAESGARP